MSAPWRVGVVAMVGVIGLAAVSALAWREVAPPPREAPAPEADTGPVMDLNHLQPQDLAFLRSVLTEGEAPGRRSAIRALVMSEDLRGVPMLLDLAERTPEASEATLACLAALDVLRLQSRADALSALEDARGRRSLPEGCRAEIDDRTALLDVEPAPLDPDPAPR
ncbi:MAG: hypothetical protein H6739_25440 [Alphaproteobacteria bacterium]|nr:hypothetical protein [Alphaproteobacteria bacterium]